MFSALSSKSPIFFPFGANLTQFGTNPDCIPAMGHLENTKKRKKKKIKKKKKKKRNKKKKMKEKKKKK